MANLARRELGLSPDVEGHFWAWLERLDQSLAAERSDLEGALAFVRDAFQVTDVDGLNMAADITSTARSRLNELEADRKRFTGPLLAAKAQVDQVFKASTNALAATCDAAKAKIARFTEAREAERRATMAASAALYAAGGTPTDVIPEPPRAKGVSVKKVWTAKVVDADLVPRALCSPDDSKIKAAISYADTDTPPRPIPGLEFVQEDRVVVRG